MHNLRLLIILWSVLSLTSNVYASNLTFRVIGVNHQVVLQKKVIESFSNVGSLTHTILNDALKNMIITEYQGSTGGVGSINQMSNQIEVISDTEMKAYGWCYQVDQQAPDVMPDAYPLQGNESVIDWFFVYAHMKNNKWLSMCTPADHMPAQ